MEKARVSDVAPLSTPCSVAFCSARYAKQEPGTGVAAPSFLRVADRNASAPSSSAALVFDAGARGGLRLHGDCGGGGAGGMVQGRAAADAPWVDASAVLVHAPTHGGTAARPDTHVGVDHKAVAASSGSIVLVEVEFKTLGAEPVEIRVGMGPALDCFLVNSNGFPARPLRVGTHGLATVASRAAAPAPALHPTAAAAANRLDTGGGEASEAAERVAPRTLEGTRSRAGVQLPPMGFNSWNRYHCWIDEEELKTIADNMVSLGLVDAGYAPRAETLTECNVHSSFDLIGLPTLTHGCAGAAKPTNWNRPPVSQR